jgi:pyroglutamyl-peptidase
MPLGLAPKVNVQKVVADAMSVVNLQEEGNKNIQVQIAPHFEAGQYLCGFLFYESLATVRKRKLDTKVIFCHVPGWEDSERLERRADAICAVIGAVCKQIQDGL